MRSRTLNNAQNDEQNNGDNDTRYRASTALFGFVRGLLVDDNDLLAVCGNSLHRLRWLIGVV